jgi:hypothetical protein
MDQARYQAWVRKDAWQWLKSRGATNKKPDGSDLIIKVDKSATRMWCGVKEIGGTHRGIYNALGGRRG